MTPCISSNNNDDNYGSSPNTINVLNLSEAEIASCQFSICVRTVKAVPSADKCDSRASGDDFRS